MGFFDTLTEAQFHGACEACMSEPVPLAMADLNKPFVYDRSIGVFYVPFGLHQSAMGLLQAIKMGLDDRIDAAEKLGVRDLGHVSDHWLQNTPGAAFRSAVSKKVMVATGRGLTPAERRAFGAFEVLFPEVPRQDLG